MCDFKIESVKKFELIKVSKGVVLWVIHADKIPPHIGLSVDGCFFSLKARGKDVDVPIKSVVSLMNLKKTAFICFCLKDCISKNDVSNSFNFFHNTIPYKITCLEPIKKILNEHNSNKIVELLFCLDQKERIEGVYGLNLPEGFNGIKDYNLDDINKRLIFLSQDL